MRSTAGLRRFGGLLALAVWLGLSAPAFAQTDPLPSWNDGPAKRAIVEFVQATTTQGSPRFVPLAEPAVVKARPELAKIEPFKTVMSGNREAMARLAMKDIEKILAATLTGMSVETFNAEVKRWLGEARDPRWRRIFTFEP